MYQELENVPWAGRHDIELTDEVGQPEKVSLSVKFSSIDTLPPIGKQKAYPPTQLVYIQAAEDGEPEGRPKVDWRLVTNLPVSSLAGAVEKLSWYAMRWKIEVFHKIMKSGCKAEDSKLRTAERLVKPLTINAVVSWRVFWITMSSRANPDSSADVAFTPTEIAILDVVVPASRGQWRPPDLAFYANRLARLGGYLDRARDPPPGNIVMWRGINRLNDIALGMRIAANLGRELHRQLADLMPGKVGFGFVQIDLNGGRRGWMLVDRPHFGDEMGVTLQQREKDFQPPPSPRARKAPIVHAPRTPSQVM